jgi:hypothetical protein
VVTPPRNAPEKALERLRVSMRAGSAAPNDVVRWITKQGRSIGLDARQAQAVQDAEGQLVEDLRFEHLRGDTRDALVQFIFQCRDEPRRDHVSTFVASHAKPPRTAPCYFPIEYLRVGKETSVLGLRLIAPTHPEAPSPIGRFAPDPPVGCLAVVDTEGTDPGQMVDRARRRVEHVLRLTRIALHEHRDLHDRQLRFRLGEGFSWDWAAGFQRSPESAFELGLDDGLVNLAESQPVARVPFAPLRQLDGQVDLSTRWIERAMFTGEPLVALLFLFFALEALLGRKSEGLKAHELALRQMVLSQVVDGGFTHPSETFLLYDRVRSAAVHGENAPVVDRETVAGFAWIVRRTLAQFLSLAEREHFHKRSQLLSYLDNHADRPTCLKWLREDGGDEWRDYLAQHEEVAAEDTN